MKRLTYTCIAMCYFLAAVSPCFAQNDFNFFQMDSLCRLLALKKNTSDSVLIVQQLVDVTPIRQSETSLYPDRTKLLLELNSRAKTMDPAPYQLIQDGNKYWTNKQYRQALKSLQQAVDIFDKQHKSIVPLLMNMRILYNLLDEQDARLLYYQEKLNYYQVNGPAENTAPCYHSIAYYYFIKGAYNQALDSYLEAADLFRQYDPHYYANSMGVIGLTYSQWGNEKKAEQYLHLILPVAERIEDYNALGTAYEGLALVADQQNRYEDALAFVNKGIGTQQSISQRTASSLAVKAQMYLKMRKPAMALPVLERAKFIADSASYKTLNNFGDMEVDYDYYLYYQLTGDFGKAEGSLLTALKNVIDQKGGRLELKYLRELADFYSRRHKPEFSEKYARQYFEISDAREQTLNKYKIAQYEIDRNDKQQRGNITRLKQEKAVQNILLWASAVVVVLILASLIFIYRQLRTNKKTLISLRQTQRQLIQSEKMASLGELTAGIAHEIQNPLNFVNNFAEVNEEMLEELKAESEKPKAERDWELETALVNDLLDNERKIKHHGKRADSIVKGMLEHSRTNTGEKQLTDLNALCDEFLKLSYHGLRAKDKNFNAVPIAIGIVTNFDATLAKANVLQQDIGRVLLNLFNNAFYAVSQKIKTSGPEYKPTVTVSTKSETGNVIICVKDNGNGIPDAIKDKIMQPFFTTKPTGEGTGLGLSLSYDIVVKGHGGSIKVDSVDGEGSQFTIQLPNI